MAEVVNSNPGYDGLKKKAIYVPHEDKIYHGFQWSEADKEVMATNVAWHKANQRMKDGEMRADYHYTLHLPPTMSMWLEEQPGYAFANAPERKKFIDKLCRDDPTWKMCQARCQARLKLHQVSCSSASKS